MFFDLSDIFNAFERLKKKDSKILAWFKTICPFSTTYLSSLQALYSAWGMLPLPQYHAPFHIRATVPASLLPGMLPPLCNQSSILNKHKFSLFLQKPLLNTPVLSDISFLYNSTSTCCLSLSLGTWLFSYLFLLLIFLSILL